MGFWNIIAIVIAIPLLPLSLPLSLSLILFGFLCEILEDRVIVGRVTKSDCEINAVYIPFKNDPLNAKKMETVKDLVQYQNTDGSWPFDDNLIKSLGSDPSDVRNNKPVELIDEAWMATVIHCIYATKVKEREMEWCLSDEKAKCYIVIYVKQHIQEGKAFNGRTEIGEAIEVLVDIALTVLKEEKTKQCYICPIKVDAAMNKEKSRRNLREIHFVLDQSGSMAGSKIIDAKRSLSFLINGITCTCTFQIYGFGSTFEKLFMNGPQSYDNASYQAAINHIKGIDANLGGTNLIQPLSDIYNLPMKMNHIRLIFVITDGCVDDLNGVINLVRINRPSNKIFSVGIGNDVSVDLVRRIAEETSGKFVFFKGTEPHAAGLINLLKAALEED